ncbi:hypothetical protein L1887_13813 [Cichorium endivia]|nr:hypothetical protein L1887_13813 [Cichorium endivia]
MSAPPAVSCLNTKSLTEIQGILKFQALAEIDDEILCSLGWTNLQHVKDLKVQFWNSSRISGVNFPVQMFYEFGIFSTFFPGKVLPDWFAHKSIEFCWLYSPIYSDGHVDAVDHEVEQLRLFGFTSNDWAGLLVWVIEGT